MGLDLRILVEYNANANFSTDAIEFARDRDLFDSISIVEKEHGIEVPEKGIECYATDGNGDVFLKTGYDKTIKSVTAQDLKHIIHLYNHHKTTIWKNKAIIDFLMNLPDDLKIWLYWR